MSNIQYIINPERDISLPALEEKDSFIYLSCPSAGLFGTGGVGGSGEGYETLCSYLCCRTAVDMKNEFFSLDPTTGILRRYNDLEEELEAIQLIFDYDLHLLVGMSPEEDLIYVTAFDSVESQNYLVAFDREGVARYSRPYEAFADDDFASHTVGRDSRIVRYEVLSENEDHIDFYSKDLELIANHTLRESDGSITRLVSSIFDACGNAYLCGQFAFEILDTNYERVMFIQGNIGGDIDDASIWFGACAVGVGVSYIITNRSFGTQMPVAGDDTIYIIKIDLETLTHETIGNTQDSMETEPEWAVVDKENNVYFASVHSSTVYLFKCTPTGTVTSLELTDTGLIGNYNEHRGFHAYYSSNNNMLTISTGQLIQVIDLTLMVRVFSIGETGGIWLPGEGHTMLGVIV